MGKENNKFSYHLLLGRQNTSGSKTLGKEKGNKVSNTLICYVEVHYKKQSYKEMKQVARKKAEV